MMLKMINRKLGTCVDVKQFMLLKLNFCRSSNGEDGRVCESAAIHLICLAPLNRI